MGSLFGAFSHYATLAANSHHTQPWRFRINEGGIEILPDLAARIPVVDPDDHHIFVSLGCAAENLPFAAEARGRKGGLTFNPANNGSVTFTFGTGATGGRTLFDAIPFRQSTRADYDGKAVSATDLQTLAAATVPGVDLILSDPAFMRELKTWLHYNPRQAIDTGDGLFSALTGNPTTSAWLGPYLISMFFSAKAENEKYARQIDSSAGIAVFVSQQDNPEH